MLESIGDPSGASKEGGPDGVKGSVTSGFMINIEAPPETALSLGVSAETGEGGLLAGRKADNPELVDPTTK